MSLQLPASTSTESLPGEAQGHVLHSLLLPQLLPAPVGASARPGTSSVPSTPGSHTRHWQLQAGAAAGPEGNSVPSGQVRALQAGAEQQHPPTPQHPSQPRALPHQARPEGSSRGCAGTTTGTSSSCLLPRQPLGLSALFRASHKQTAKIAEVTWHRQSAHVSAQARSHPRPYKLPHRPCRVQLHPHVASSPDLTRLGAGTDPRDPPQSSWGLRCFALAPAIPREPRRDITRGHCRPQEPRAAAAFISPSHIWRAREQAAGARRSHLVWPLACCTGSEAWG